MPTIATTAKMVYTMGTLCPTLSSMKLGVMIMMPVLVALFVVLGLLFGFFLSFFVVTLASIITVLIVWWVEYCVDNFS